MKVGLCTIAFSTRPLEEVLALAADIGFDGVEIWGKEPHMKADPDGAYASEVRALAESQGIEINSFGSYMTPLTPKIPERTPLDDNLAITRALGASIMRIWAPHAKPEQIPSSEYERAAAELRQFSAMAQRSGIVLGVEFHDNTIVETSEGMLRLLGDVNSPNLRAYWQPSFRAGAEDFYDSLERLLPHVVNVHAQNFRGAYQRRTYLSDGDVDYRRVVRMLADSGYDGYIEIEFVGAEEPEEWVRRDYEFLREIAGGGGR